MTWSTRLLLSSAVLVAAALPLNAISHARRGPTSPKLSSKHSKQSAKPVSQRAIDPERATEIQNALIKSGYLPGPATGQWDVTTQAAMQKLQADNGWQTKLIPDSRAIIKLGLGPAQDSGTNSVKAEANPATAFAQ